MIWDSRKPVAERYLGHYVGLDLLRALAIAWVMLFHAATFNLADYDFPLVNTGWIGVDIFFVLSGFLIGSQICRSLQNSGSLDFGAFYRRRAFRTLPAYGIVLAIYFALPGLREYKHIAPLWQFATFTENVFVRLEHSMSFSHVWSLCVEEQFYLAVPLVVALMFIHANLRRSIVLIMMALLFGIACRYGAWMKYVSPHELGGIPGEGFNVSYVQHVYYPTWNRLDGLIFGVSAAAIRSFRPGWWIELTRLPNMLLIMGCAGVVATLCWFGQLQAQLLQAVFGYPLLNASILAVVISATCETSLITRMRVPGARALALISYSLYLSHKLCFQLVDQHATPWLRHHPLCLLGSAFLLALAGGTVLYLAVERPFLLLRDRHRQQARLAATAATRPA